MKSFWSKWRERFERTVVQVPWFGPVISAVFIALLVNVLTEALTEWGGLWLGWAVVLLLGLATVAFVYAYTTVEMRRRNRGLGPLADRPNPRKYRGLILSFSQEATAREAVEYHQATLEHCWFLVTPQLQDRAAQFITSFPGVRFTIHPLNDRYDSQACYQTVLDICRQEAPRLGIPPDQVIADITGGTKPMTMGMIVACLEEGYAIEHVPTAFDAAGQPTGPLPPIHITVQGGAGRASDGD